MVNCVLNYVSTIHYMGYFSKNEVPCRVLGCRSTFRDRKRNPMFRDLRLVGFGVSEAKGLGMNPFFGVS